MNFQALFQPQAIAVIGASSHEKTVGNDVVKNLVTQGFAGKIYPVNPKIDELYGLPVYHQTSDIDGVIDLVVLAIPARLVADEIRIAATKGAKAAIVISAGFKETGNGALEKELAATCAANGVTLVGPNCLGVINPSYRMNASFAAVMPPAGEIAFISQSGALCTAVLDYAKYLGIGFSKFMSIGNKAAINELELIKFLHNDLATKVICIYAESLENAPDFIATLRELNRGSNPKPVIVLKSGKTEAGAGAVASHTGSLSSGDVAYQALFRQAGIIRAESISELFDLAQLFAMNQVQKIEQVAILTNAGGPGVLVTDSVIEHGLQLAQLEEKTVTALKTVLPACANFHNPIDILGDAVGETYEQALEILSQDAQIDALIVLLTPQSMTEPAKTAESIVRLRQHTQKPIVVSLMGKELVAEGVEILRANDVAQSAFPEAAAIALAKFADFCRFALQKNEAFLQFTDVDRARVSEIFAGARERKQTSFPEAEAMAIMQAYRFPLLKSAVAKNASQALELAKEFDCELAMKIVSPDILHKSDVGGVALKVTKETVIQEYETMLQRVHERKPEARLEGVLLMEMAKPGAELIVGVNKNSLGTMLMIGLGGIYVEVLKDVSFAFAPLTRSDIMDLLDGLRSKKILEGVRGMAAADKEAIIEVVGRLAQLITDFPEIVELDINPLLVNQAGAKVLDARIVIEAI